MKSSLDLNLKSYKANLIKTKKLYQFKKETILIYECNDFDDKIDDIPGYISEVFYTGQFIVNCVDGRILINKYENVSNKNCFPKKGMILEGKSFYNQMVTIIDRHKQKFPKLKLNKKKFNLKNKFKF